MYPFKLEFLYSLGKYLVVQMLSHTVTLFLTFWGNLHIGFYSGYISLHSHQECKRIPLSPHPSQHLLFVLFLAILTAVR